MSRNNQMLENDLFIIVGAGDLTAADLEELKAGKAFIAAADAGYLPLLNSGIKPDLIVGDFDSSGIPDIETEIIRLDVRKDDTDMVFCVKEGLKRGYRRFKLYGALGGSRISHTIANLQLLSMIAEEGAEGEIVFGSVRLFLMKAGEERKFPEGMAGTVSFFAVSDKARLSIKGLDYELCDGELSRHFPLGVSNHFTGKEALVQVFEGEVLAVLEENVY